MLILTPRIHFKLVLGNSAVLFDITNCDADASKKKTTTNYLCTLECWIHRVTHSMAMLCRDFCCCWSFQHLYLYRMHISSLLLFDNKFTNSQAHISCSTERLKSAIGYAILRLSEVYILYS